MALSGIAAKSHPVIPPPVIHHSASQSLPWSGSGISEFGQIPVLAAQVADGFPQSFKLEVPEYRILHGTPDAFRTGRTVSNPLFRRCLSSCFPAPVPAPGSPRPLWHRYLLPTIRDHNRDAPSWPFRLRRKGTHPRCRDSVKYGRPSWKIPFVQGGYSALRGP